MVKDYIIDDNDGYNWVSLSKPLSNYTQEELALQLISNKQEYGTTQKIRIGGKIGAILNTDGCETPEDFINKYQNILDRAGFKKGNNKMKEEIKENDTLTIKPKALSKVSFMDYTQEELAHLIMDDKIKNNDGSEYGVYEHRDTVFDSTGCYSIKDFIDKYQEEFNKRRIKSENPVLEENNNKEDGKMKIIEVPFGMFNYTQEDLAHLVMDNKNSDEVVGIRISDGTILDSEGCNTVEEFIKKNENVLTNAGINHDFSEQIKQANLVEDKNHSIDFDPVIPKVEVNTEPEELIVNNTNEKSYSLDFDPVIPKVEVNGPINKVESNNEQSEIVEENITKADALEDSKLSYEETLDALLKERNIQIAVSLFKIARGNYYNGTADTEQVKLDTIQKMNNEYVALFNEKENINFNNESEVSEWLNKLVPYINTHALNLNLGINVTLESADKYLLEVMEEKGYTDDINSAVSPEQKKIARKLKELKEYHFFVSDYKNLPEENKNLNSKKTMAMAEINHLDHYLSEGNRALELINKDLTRIKENTDKEIAHLEAKMIECDTKIMQDGKTEFSDMVETEAEKNANDLYLFATKTHEIGDINDAVKLAQALPDDSKIKEKLLSSTEKLFENNTYYEEKFDDETAIERRNYSNQIKKLKENYENIENKYASATVKINKNIESVTEKLNYLRTTYKLEDYKFKTSQNNRIDEPKVEETGIEYNLEPEKKVGIVDKIKDKFTNKKEVNHIDNEYLNKLESIEKVFTDTDSIDKNHEYLSASNARNLGYIDTITEGPKEEVVSTIEMEEEPIKEEMADVQQEKEETHEVKKFELEKDEKEPVKFENNEEFEFSLEDDQYDLSIDDLKDSLKDFVAINSFKQISKDLYEKINQSKVKQVVKKAVEKLNEKKKAACIYLGFAAAIAVGVFVGTNVNGMEKDLQTNISATYDNNSEDNIETNDIETNDIETNDVETVVSDKTTDNVNATTAAEEEYTVSFDEAASAAINDVLEGKNEAYKSFADAYTETNAVANSDLYTPSWESATTGEYFVEKNGVMNHISKDEAIDYYNNGEEVVESVKNNNTVIGYINIDKNDTGKSL